MELREARGIAAQLWCTKNTSHLAMIPELAETFAQRLVEEVKSAVLTEQLAIELDERIAA